MRTAKLVLGVALLALPACSPLVRFAGTLTVQGVANPVPARLHAAASLRDGEPVPVPDGHSEWVMPPGQSASFNLERDGEALEYTVQVIGSTGASLDARFWYDTNGDGVMDPGEPSAELPSPVEGQDRGIWGNLTNIDPVHLE